MIERAEVRVCPLVRPLTDSDTVHTYTQSAHTDTQTPLVTGKRVVYLRPMMDLKSTDMPFNGGASTTLAACYRHARCQAFVAAMRRERRQKASGPGRALGPTGGASRVGSLITGSGAEPQKKILPIQRFYD